MTDTAAPLLTGLPATLPARLGAGHGWERCLVVLLNFLRSCEDDGKPMRLLPCGRLAPAILPIVGSATGATSGGDDLGGSVVGERFSEGHGQTIHGKNKSAMPKIILVIRRQCRHLTHMSNTNHIATIAFFAATDAKTKTEILAAIAKHYGISESEALEEVTDEEAESLLDYLTGSIRTATSLLMKRHGIAA